MVWAWQAMIALPVEVGQGRLFLTVTNAHKATLSAAGSTIRACGRTGRAEWPAGLTHLRAEANLWSDPDSD